jgi:hypothetical protein
MRRISVGMLLLIAACNRESSGGDDLLSVSQGPQADLGAWVDLSPADASAIPHDLALPIAHDLAVPQDLAAPIDLQPPPDLATPDDQSASSDPFDPASCQGPPLPFADAYAMRMNATDFPVTILMRRRVCSPSVNDCQPWQPATSWPIPEQHPLSEIAPSFPTHYIAIGPVSINTSTRAAPGMYCDETDSIGSVSCGDYLYNSSSGITNLWPTICSTGYGYKFIGNVTSSCMRVHTSCYQMVNNSLYYENEVVMFSAF